jgi:Holliday junction DNA helicase RuvA
MIGQLRGTITSNGNDYLILDVAGVGYKVFAAPEEIHRHRDTAEASFWIHTAVRENSIDLYGFATQTELTFFELLLGVSGIGPKSALGILSVAPVNILTSAVAAGDTSYLTKVSGIGKKSASKIVLELQDKLGTLVETGQEHTLRQEESDALDALTALGYGAHEAREALKETGTATTTGEKIRAALQILGGDR